MANKVLIQAACADKRKEKWTDGGGNPVAKLSGHGDVSRGN